MIKAFIAITTQNLDEKDIDDTIVAIPNTY
jgi:hypothetical protein